MSRFASLLVASCLVAIGSGSYQYASVNTSYASYVQHFQRNVQQGSAEYALREELFNQRVATVVSHNSQPHFTWTKAVNHLSDWTDAELKGLRGHKRMPPMKASPVEASSSFIELGVEACGAHTSSCEHSAEACCDGLICGSLGKCEQKKQIPESFDDWKKLPNADKIGDQGSCGSCWALAATHVIQFHAAIRAQKEGSEFKTELSPQSMLACTDNPNSCGGTGGCEGATSWLGMEWVASQGGEGGLRSATDDVYTASSSDRSMCGAKSAQADAASYLQLRGANAIHGSGRTQAAVGIKGVKKLATNDKAELMSALVNNGPVAVSIVGGGLSDYHGGVFDGCNGDFAVDHAVVMMGYGKDNSWKSGKKAEVPYWKIRNSWGGGWGEHGTFRMRRHLDTDADPEPEGQDTETGKGYACKDDVKMDNGEDGYPKSITVKGECGILSDSVIPNFVNIRHQ